MKTQTFLAEETILSDQTVQVYHSKTLGWSPAYSFFLKHYAELIDAGHCFPFTSWEDSTAAIVYAKLDDKIVGIVAYTLNHHEFTNALWIILTAIDQDHRQLGISKILHQHAEKIAREDHKELICCHIALDNQSIIRSLGSEGIVPVGYLMTKIL